MSLLFTQNIFSQRTCATDDIHQQLLLTDSEYAQNRTLIEQQIEKYINEPHTKKRTVITIPVVVHVIYNTVSQNISDAQINSQIAILNQDFRKLNADWTNTPSVFQSAVADCEIEFCLAKRDPNGNATTGITRTSTTVTSFTSNNAMKYTAQGGKDGWDRNQYLNIWVCKLSGGLLGYAQFPGGYAPSDGIVCKNTAFGNMGSVIAPYNKGRTATHEIAHWLNLYHIWGDDGGSCSGSDLVGDTPNQGAEHYGCPSFPQVSSCSGGNGEMYMNYMDYTDDACMVMFTAGQKARMQATFNGVRSSLLTSMGCLPVTNCGNISGVHFTPASSTSQNVNWNAIPGATSYQVEYKLSTATTWSSMTVTTNTATLSGLVSGSAYDVRFLTYCNGGASNYSNVFSFRNGSCASSISNVNMTITNITNNSAKLDWSVVNGGVMVAYNIFYKKSTDNIWNIAQANTNTLTLNNLEQNVTYNIKIQLVCLNNPNAYSSFYNLAPSGAPINTTMNFNTLKKCDYTISELEAWNTYKSATTTNVGMAWTHPVSSDITSIGVEYYLGATPTWVSLTATAFNTGYGSATVNNVALNTSFTVRARAVCTNIGNVNTYGPYTNTYNFYTANNASPECTDVEPNNTSATATTITPSSSTTVVTTSKLSVLNDLDYFKITTTTAQPKLKLRLKNLPLNYSLSLYDASMNLIANALSNNIVEFRDIIYNDATVGATYYAKVYPTAPSNYDNNICYRLLTTVATNDFRYGTDYSKTEVGNFVSSNEKLDVEIYPNPAKDIVTIVLESNGNKLSQINLYNIQGQVIYSKEYAINEGQNNIPIELHAIPNGVYYLLVSSNGKKDRKKIVVSH